MAHKYKLTYLGVRGRGESTMMLLAAHGEEYEDYRVDLDKAQEETRKSPQGTLPYLTIDGNTTVAQWMAINRYFAREFSMYGQTNLEALFIDEIVDTCVTLLEQAEKASAIRDENKKKEAVKTFTHEIAHKYLRFLESSIVSRVGEKETGFAVGSKLSLADIMIFNVIETGRLEGELVEYPRVTVSREKVLENERIAMWLKIRP
ncbi:S-crystallin SL11-like [Mercenaria mercenaria]|uniref:S-crystallin SL11-like n=1 Tax=Mercenaria mercenaria TaxID=6596 RepID=UPI00234F49BC|nr:S-crystallin SL11-like [Mercenaria mercenaria]